MNVLVILVEIMQVVLIKSMDISAHVPKSFIGSHCEEKVKSYFI